MFTQGRNRTDVIRSAASKHSKLLEICRNTQEHTQVSVMMQSYNTAHWEQPRKASHSEYSIAIHSVSVAGYVTAVLAIVCAELCAWEASFCDF